MRKTVTICDACKTEIPGADAAVGVLITDAKHGVVATFSNMAVEIERADRHACGIKCAMDIVGHYMLKVGFSNAT